MTTASVTISFSEPASRIELVSGDSVLDGAHQNGIDIIATCGGRGRCRSCRVKLIKGGLSDPTVADRLQLSEDEIREGYRLSCQTLPSADATLAIAPPMNETSFQILVDTKAGKQGHGVRPDSGIVKFHIHPDRPKTEVGKISELDVLLGGEGRGDGLSLGLETARTIALLPEKLDAGVTIARTGDRVLSVEPGDTTVELYGLAFDIGSTTVVGYLINLTSGEVIASASGLNPQTVFGGDLISRIGFAAQSKANTRSLHSRIIAYINDLTKDICTQAEVSPEHIYKVTIVGNTCMHHLFLGIDPSTLGQAPYLPVIRDAYTVNAREAGLRLNRGATLHTLPLVAGFVGADAVGMILSTRLDTNKGISIAADIGTNAEVVLNGPAGLFACSSPAGPALEGGQIRDGMRAALGAIDKVTIDNDIVVHTIGDVPALGICGSGLIDAVAALLDVGVIAPSGRILPEPPDTLPKALAERVIPGEGATFDFVMVWAKDSANRSDIVLSQGDVRQLQLAKAAILSGVIVLINEAGVRVDDITELNLAGGFGNYLNINNARRIGLIPDVSTLNVHYVANAAGLGAQMALISEKERNRAAELADKVTHVALAGYPEFQKIYMKAMGFPKTRSEKT